MAPELSAVDTVLCADTIHTMDAGGSAVTAIALSNGQIIGLGQREDISRWSGPDTEVIDLGSATITPGFTDSHIHPVGGIHMTRGVSLTHCKTQADVLQVLRQEESTLEDGEWLLGWELNPNIFESGKISNSFFEGVFDNRSVLIRLYDQHSALVSNDVVLRAGLVDHPPAERSQNVGWLVEFEEMQPANELMPALTIEQRATRLHRILTDMASTGFTEGYVLDFDDDETIEVLRAAEALAPLALDLRISPWIMPDSTPEYVQRITEMQGLRGDRWRVEGVKLMIDGTIDNGTAWLYQPDTKGESTASIWLDTTQYRQIVTDLHAKGIATTTHAIGDNGIGFVAEVLSALPPSSVQHRIEHIEVVTDDDIHVMATGGVSASMQPIHCTHFAHPDGSDNWSVRLGPERAAFGFRMRDIRAAGIPLALGSDWPVSECDARTIFTSAVMRRPAGKDDSHIILGGQALTPMQTLEGFTTQAQKSIGAVPRTISVGHPATFSVFSDDPLTADPDVFAQTTVVMTMIRGDIAIDNRDAQGLP